MDLQREGTVILINLIAHFTFYSFTVLNKLKALQLRKVGLSTIKRQHGKNLARWTEAT